ncbi:hypothetical protein EV182_008876, partial [Spiromyces aspiralis]
MSSDNSSPGGDMGTARQLSPESPRHLAPNVGGGMSPPAVYRWPYLPFVHPGMPGIPRFTGTRIRQFLEDYEALATRM